MTFDEWLDEPQTVTTRRERLERFMGMPDDFHRREMLIGWLIGAWNGGVENGNAVPRSEAGLRMDGVPLYAKPAN